MYDDYKQARDMAWDMLLKERIVSLPVKVSDLCKSAGAKVVSYSKGEKLLRAWNLMEHTKKTDGFTFSYDGRYIIFYNEACSVPRIRFTLAHELGHIMLGHIAPGEVTLINREPSSRDNPTEQGTNVFASRLLAPTCVLWALSVTTADEIMELCDISRPAAEYRLARLLKLYERDELFQATRGHGCFLSSPQERKVYKRFLPYIRRNRS